MKKKALKSIHKRECRRHGNMSIDNFYKCSHSNGGYFYRCKQCVKNRYLRNRKYILEYARWYSARYYKKNKEEILRKARKEYRRDSSKRRVYYIKNRDKYLQRSKINYYKDIDRQRARSRDYYWKNRKRLLKKMKVYRDMVRQR